ncbi:hypothetical protein HKBW3S33_00113 [Candidatus Hakubella thermalkaliphila]|uniref:Uncharacterized protein n=1 Tax=Candidatus Hakubella thermalkaliphila TaxID=2754717 RepID=A0A6V8P2J2_9ACTN|nr:hypothetical protein HKBW3S33_00113 [Candidatus Hakubella thermalkaliphila]
MEKDVDMRQAAQPGRHNINEEISHQIKPKEIHQPHLSVPKKDFPAIGPDQITQNSHCQSQIKRRQMDVEQSR